MPTPLRAVYYTPKNIEMHGKNTHALRMKMLPIVSILALSGCGSIHTLEVRDPTGPNSMIRSNVRDLIHTVGTPSHYTKFSDPRGAEFDTLEVEWDFTNSDSAFSVSIPLLASVQIGGAGRCAMTATVARMGGVVDDVAFPQSHVDGWEPDASACGPLVSEWISHRSTTYLPPAFDAFTLPDDARKR